ncbi:MAG: molybdopterin synthase sulfur carrier subunit [gamma proteobacterium symbiont of Ctena orbiculata]|nr:MAG: molybdopterin synthase sulfur carrier subunit [gamma proteobacterium symbiont of Ctena orbiculata]PVV19781.1 MAG: molybdopterin synthase sulfur carrier subunit [gamma proteobacterium symbiont of Ctena orbiculata]
MSEVTVEFKLYASLMDYLPAGAHNHAIKVKLSEGATVFDVMDRYQVPREQAHLVVCNGVFMPPSQRQAYQLQDGDVIALWPPVAGG